MFVGIVPNQPGGWLIRSFDEAGLRSRPLSDNELADPAIRWVFDSVGHDYPALCTSGRTVARAHDISLTERILLGRQGRFAEQAGAAAVLARRDGIELPPDDTDLGGEPTLFSAVSVPADPETALDRLAGALADQQRRIVDSADAGPLGLLVAAESAAALAAAEMGRAGLPLNEDEHDRFLVEQLGPRPVVHGRPARLTELNRLIDSAFGFSVNPDSPSDLKLALERAGFSIDSTRKSALRQVDHPAVPLLRQYKELSRLFTANGWQWLSEWVSGGRFRTEYLPGAVVSGRWAARGGGALQIPRSVRRAVIAEPGRVFVVADAAQLEPRILAALSFDPDLQTLSAGDDLYQALADDAFDGNRATAKVAMLGAMYGATTGESGRLLPTLRRRYPVAMHFVEQAAAEGERGGTVRSVLGRASPPPGDARWSAVQAGAGEEATAAEVRRGTQVARGWGRFTRNFVVQASAADWASVWLSLVRLGLHEMPDTELVFFQHDELVVHCPPERAGAVSELTMESAERARGLVFPAAAASTPVRPVTVRRYSDAK